jgi:hypothetical protein
MSFHQRTRQPEAIMRSASEHYEEAERLLALARTEQDSIRRSLILAEAQVHAILALSAPAGIGPAGPGQDRAADTKSTGTAHQTLASPSPGTPTYAHPRWPKGTDLTPARPAGQPGPRGSRLPPDNEPVREVAPAAPAGFVRTGNPSQPVPGPVPGQPVPVDPGEKEAGDLDDQKPRGPEEQKPDGLGPF